MTEKIRYRAVKRIALPGERIRITTPDETLELKKGDEFTAMVIDTTGMVTVLKGQLSPKNYTVLVKY